MEPLSWALGALAALIALGAIARRRAAAGRPEQGATHAAEQQPATARAEPRASDSGLLERVNAKERFDAARQQKGTLWRYIAYGAQPAPIASYRGTVEDPRPGAIGICCSGGGVRSAAFNLGALQELQEAGELGRAEYLAAVSGGSYIAAAFSMLARGWPTSDVSRPPRDPADEDNGHDDSNPALIRSRPPFSPRSPEEQYLRNRSSYLAPSATDKLYLGYRIVLGVLVNFSFLALPLFGVAMLLGATAYQQAFPRLLGHCGTHCSAHLPAYMWWPPVGIVATSGAVGVLALLVRLKSDRGSKALEIWSTRLLLLAVLVAWLTVALPLMVAAVTGTSSTGVSSGSSGIVGGGGLTALVVAVSAYLREMLASPTKALDELQQGTQRLAKLSSGTRRLIAYIAGAIVGPALLLSVMVLGVALALAKSKPGPINGWLVLAGCAALAIFVFLYLIVDLTSWSLHPFYKRRLCTAFALKRVLPSEQVAGEQGYGEQVIPQEADVAVGEREGIAVERDFDVKVPMSETAFAGSAGRPTLLVCAAANISDQGATPPGRSVTSFTFSAHAIGGPLVGGVSTKDFEKSFASEGGRRRRDFTLPAAVAMSGAALSPSMGKLTRRPFTFLMALANIRLGVWVPNPRWVADTASGWRYFGRARPSYLLRELIGRNRVDAKYLYVTDGGHYENLGLVELLRRGCTKIYCFDASGGQKFQELGDAIALARSELGVSIEIDPSELTPSGDAQIAKADTASGSFTYKQGVGGRLVYSRNVMTEDAPWDVKAYHEVDQSFPHNPTADQLYTDQRFEAYRELGACAGRNALAQMRAS
jgi:hypothetical protein